MNINNYNSRKYDPRSSKISKVWYVWAIYRLIELKNKYENINPKYNMYVIFAIKMLVN